MTYILLYLTAIILANLSSAYFGPGASIVNAFVLIGFDLVARDKLHDAWHNNGLAWKMATLIAVGSLLSWVINRNAGQIALASFAAFACAGVADTLAYSLLGGKAKLLQINGSNVVSAAIDSLVFPTLAFGGIMPWITLGQFVAKVTGGFLWSWFLMDKSKRRDFLCKWGWHQRMIEIDFTHEQCSNCKKIYEFNPYWNV